MNLKAHYSEKLSKMLFLNIRKEKLKEIFNIELKEDIYIPVATEQLASKVKSGDLLDIIPMSFFIEGMFYVLGADPYFKFNEYYKEILLKGKDTDKYIKHKIAKDIKNKLYEEAYIKLKGLCTIEAREDNFSKLLFLCDKLRVSSNMYIEEENELIDKCKKFNENFAEPYLYEGLVLRDKGDFNKAYYCINTYLSKGGENTKEITDLKESLKLVNEYDKAKTMVDEEPQEALKILIPLIDTLGDTAEIYYYIAVSYRNMGNHDKAIYYLNDALAIDSNAVEIINEAGLNYASIGEYEKAISYFRTAFSYTGSVEICTNLVMCYLNINDIKQAKAHFKMAKNLDPKDEIVLQLESIISNI